MAKRYAQCIKFTRGSKLSVWYAYEDAPNRLWWLTFTEAECKNFFGQSYDFLCGRGIHNKLTDIRVDKLIGPEPKVSHKRESHVPHIHL